MKQPLFFEEWVLTVAVKNFCKFYPETYHQKSNLITSAEIYRKCAVASTQEEFADIRIASSQAADELLGIKGVNASFVMYTENGKVNISPEALGLSTYRSLWKALEEAVILQWRQHSLKQRLKMLNYSFTVLLMIISEIIHKVLYSYYYKRNIKHESNFIKDVKGSGKAGDTLNVADGYARNFYCYKKDWRSATAKNLNDLAGKRLPHSINLTWKKKKMKKKIASSLEGKEIVIKAKAGQGGKLFGAVTSATVADAVSSVFAVS